MNTARVAIYTAVGSLIAGGIAPAAVAQDEREHLDVRVFAEIGAPGYPEGIAVDTDGTTYVGTNNSGIGTDPRPSKVFAFTSDGDLVREYTIEGQTLDEGHGILGMAFDADGVLYILDRSPARVVTLDPDTGDQATYATFADVAPCRAEGPDGSCSDTVEDLPSWPDYLVFAPDGTMYVTDIQQGLIWRVPRGGGQGTIWFTDRALDSVLGPNGIQFLPDGRTLLFVQTFAMPPGEADAATAKLYTLPVTEDGSAGQLEEFWEGRPGDGADGFAIAESSNIYLALALANQVVQLSPDGEELAKGPATPLGNLQQEVPFDGPASIAFEGDRLLLTNQAFFTANPDHWVVFDVFAGEPGMPLYRPEVTN